MLLLLLLLILAKRGGDGADRGRVVLVVFELVMLII
jgi:hypothetical protein